MNQPVNLPNILGTDQEVINFVAAAQAIKIKWEKDMHDAYNSSSSADLQLPAFESKTFLSIEDLQKFIKIIVNEQEGYGSGRSVWGFIAKFDFSSKELGNVKRGDILKAANFKAPAKHARGNLFDDSKGLSRINWYGPMYIKG